MHCTNYTGENLKPDPPVHAQLLRTVAGAAPVTGGVAGERERERDELTKRASAAAAAGAAPREERVKKLRRRHGRGLRASGSRRRGR